MYILILTVLLIKESLSNECAARKTEFGIICVCNSTYCDTFPTIANLEEGNVRIYSTSKEKAGLEEREGKFSDEGNTSSVTITVHDQKLQKITGFGAAFTDAAGINIRSLSSAVQKKLFESYFGKDGIEYSLCRVPIGCTDFSERPYSYDDHPGDDKLEHFQLQHEDFTYKIPLIKEAKRIRGKALKLFSTIWSPPKWMKTGGTWGGFNLLKSEYYQVYADYFKKFFDEYAKEDIRFWGTTTGNEPQSSFLEPHRIDIPALGWLPEQQMQWIIDNLGPTLRKHHKEVKIILHDDDRPTVPYFVPLMLNNSEALKYIDGVALHWYFDKIADPQLLNFVYTDKKELELIMSEACFEVNRYIPYGDWSEGEKYAASIIFYLQRGFSAWIDWNIAISTKGGPSYIGNFVNSPIVVNSSAQEFYKQPIFYVMGHFSKFAVPDSIIRSVEISEHEKHLKSIAFIRPDNVKGVVILHNGANEVDVQIKDGDSYSESIKLQPQSLNTILYK